MTHVPTTAQPGPAGAPAADATVIDVSARGPLLLLLGSGIVWLTVSGLLALITSIQLHSPHFLSSYPYLTHGRAEALRETAFLYGWAANAGLAIVLWVLGRLGGQPLRALNWVFAGAVFWNLAVTASLVGIAAGDMTSFPRFQPPRYLQPVLVVAYAAIAVSGVLAWTGRRTRWMFASHWYAVAALFLFPWLSSVSQLVLLWWPTRGVVQVVAADWCAQGVWSFWLAPMALAAAYYLVPKTSGRVLPVYDFAPLGFWVLITVGGWAGARHLIGGPVPAWLVTLAIVAAVLLLVHYAIVALNLRIGWRVPGATARFIRFGVVAYLLAGVLDAITSLRSVAVETQFTLLGDALGQLASYGGISMIFFGAIYHMVPRLAARPWASAALAVGHRALVTFGVVVLVVTLAVAGWTQGVDLLNARTSFTEIFDHVRLSLLAASGAQLVLLGANLLLLVNFLQTIRPAVVADVVTLNPVQPRPEASVS